MPQSILVLLRHPENAESLLNAAARLADIMEFARINALAIEETIELTPGAATTLAGRFEEVVAVKEAERRRILDLKDIFTEWATRVANHADTFWFEAEGNTGALVARWGQRADIIVAARPTPNDRIDRETLRIALLGTDRPVLMVPPPTVHSLNATFGRRVAIAWRDERHALRAVLAALPWLQCTDEVHVLIGLRDPKQAVDVPTVLVEHGILVSLHALAIHPGSFGQRLLDTAHHLGADLLVMGAYAHQPLREIIFGGATRHILTHAELPVLMRH
jgi:nucleotide-binding universal stress UspA family protein